MDKTIQVSDTIESEWQGKDARIRQEPKLERRFPTHRKCRQCVVTLSFPSHRLTVNNHRFSSRPVAHEKAVGGVGC